MERPAVVMDNGTGYTKIGYAGCAKPNFIFPTTVAEPPPKTNRDTLDDLDFYIGKEAVDIVNYTGGKYHQYNPVKHGIVENWDQMEKLWQHSIYKYLRCEPEDHAFLLTESPFNPPENREYTAEIMFETFGVQSLHIAVQAVLALAASWGKEKAKQAGLKYGEMSGTVIDSGDGVTHIIPVSHGYVIQSGIKHIGLAGKDITKYMFDIIKEREPTHPDVNMMLECQKLKEEHCYVCRDLSMEFAKYDSEPKEHIKQWEGVVPKTKAKWKVDVGPERFLGPELFFHPEIFSLEHTTPLPILVDEMICGCPIDTRKSLYRNIVLSGGSTMFKHFGQRLKRDIKERVNARMEDAHRRRRDQSVSMQDVPVNVISHKAQGYAVWSGGSVIASMDNFPQMVKTRAEYEEHGPSIFRSSALGGSVFDQEQ
eukprot:TRINITY_DN23039_c1_g1_i1.p1 TRINITY_DN23039_c1_g1~~TRINITY_DN23039_c1_g1_i1.p1  ORF type:complete len:432 (+),score=92.79 TRINITY_DN23039_c1_g1_i1:25-1296(+)